MSRFAVFVDAGYLFAQGSAALAGTKQPRASLSLNVAAAIGELVATSRAVGITQPLLRVYWYDGARNSSALPIDHAEIAHTAFVKLRLGMINGAGQQKGVDSLIVTDLIELARNHAIDDAVLLSGDDDIRVGVTIAQTFGVCVHVIGIEPSIGSQSPLLLQEADTTTEWTADIVGRFLSQKAGPSIASLGMGIGNATTNDKPGYAAGDSSVVPEARPALNDAIQAHFEALPQSTIFEITQFWASQNVGIPADIDRSLLAACRKKICRSLSRDETRYMRDRFGSLVRNAKSLLEERGFQP